MIGSRAAWLLMSAMAAAGPAWGQTTLPESPEARGQVDSRTGALIYPADFYASARPVTALDMIARTPGFTLDEGDSVRGLSGAQGNVLVDGRRPTSKGEDLGDLIARIAAGQVERIEIVRDRGAGLDMQGHAVVANIVRRADATASGAISLSSERHADDRWATDAVAEMTRSLSGGRLLELSGSLYSYIDDEAGDGREELRDASGGLIGSADRSSDAVWPTASSAASRRAPGTPPRPTCGAAWRWKSSAPSSRPHRCRAPPRPAWAATPPAWTGARWTA